MIELNQVYKARGSFRLYVEKLRFNTGLHLISGPNGAGKSTLLQIIASADVPDKGTVSYNGIPYQERLSYVRGRIGFVPGESVPYEDMTALTFLSYMGGLKGVTDSVSHLKLLELFGLKGERGTRVNRLSLGNQRRLMLAQSLLGAPDILVLDEPLTHVDGPEQRRIIALLALYGRARTVIVSSHEPEMWDPNQTVALNNGSPVIA
ncbi:ATP-binding cassette domain-containing protein [Paenibacillus apiarius]|uniref:ABC transporter ATP-binding protein n=1 Tax=Paenibacillus apiarius TaxID=46240 RepID=A0ABT4DTS3_9BACL|nr:ABC transporter ATP-binding protein [Paenibacillus apiarius]MCY9515842.1 ABC transporter ATP-binding protein [Paenibacillus apiarius]MCY9520752.1 ABC transporter ATP-binding protein [Paenibacillus apiarius]MCY9553456.1 ABC transporter ATP-binding protein [Paenibacillus apiarius]MCY9558020.1 ABC transporter ATP-binding protein [Paenibacillus apiarius]MCY9685875.1 ABC transporter ATP-binding protein [Paenibacillus apiarius]